MRKYWRRVGRITAFALILYIIGTLSIREKTFETGEKDPIPETNIGVTPTLASIIGQVIVTRVIDGDTIEVRNNNQKQTIRLIGINTPESVDPRRPVECYGKEASIFLAQLILDQEVILEADPSQTNQDKYNRLLRYVFLTDKRLVNKILIDEGFAYEYTYENPYKYQSEFRTAQSQAQQQKKGLWNPKSCPSPTITPTNTSGCQIKGNITAEGDKIYHLPVCPAYEKTIISINKGERWFCDENAATQSGWRKASNCP